MPKNQYHCKLFALTWLNTYTQKNTVNFAIGFDSESYQSFAVGLAALMASYSGSRQAALLKNFDLFIYLKVS